MSNLTGITNGVPHGNLTLFEYPDLCTLQTCDLTLSSFLYRPTAVGNAIFAAIFALYIVAQIFLGIRYKIWGYMAAMVLGLFLELIGYIARVLIHNNPFDHDYFLMYLVCLTIAPALLSASIYLCLSRIVNVYGENLSRFKARTYTIVFCSCDLLCLVLQALGGGIASTANTNSATNLGKNIMLAGLIIQVISLTLFAIACGDFFLRVRNNQSQWNPEYTRIVNSGLFKAFLIGLTTATITIFIRSVYRCAELAGGFDGNLFKNDEAAFMILEGLMIVVATTCLTFLHPGIAFQGAWDSANFSFRGKNNSKEGYQPQSDEESR